jgi:hypothetical protein
MRSNKSWWNVHGVAGSHKHHVAQVKIDLDIVITELVVLLGVQHLQQCAGRVAPEISPQLVDFVQQEQRIARANLGQALQHLARHRANIGAAVAANFGLVAHAAQRHAHVLAPGRLGNRLPQRGFAHARRTNQTQYGRLHFIHALLHSKIFQNTVFNLVQTVMIFIQTVSALPRLCLILVLAAHGKPVSTSM